MKVELDENELAALGLTPAERASLFVREYPEWFGRTDKLLGTFLTCQGESVDLDDLDAALRHVQDCCWCSQRLAQE